jgi:hypothetical protein
MRRRTIRQHDFAHEGFDVALILREVAHVALERIAQRPLRTALPAPIHGRDREAARAEVAHGLEIFLDEFGAALEQADGALAAGRRRKTREAKTDAVLRLQHARDGIVGHRIGWDGNEGHCESCAAGARLIERNPAKWKPEGGKGAPRQRP